MDLTSILGGVFSLHEPEKYVEPAELQLKAEMMATIGFAPDEIILDGRLHRFATSGRRKDDAGWYIAFGGDVPAGCFGDWRNGEEYKWVANIGRDLSADEIASNQRRIAAAKEQRAKEAKQAHEDAAKKAVSIIDACLPLIDHPYTAARGISGCGLLVSNDGRIVVPMYDVQTGEIAGVQFISADGEKRFIDGCKAKGAAWVAGQIDASKGIYIAEGAAKAIAIYQAVGVACVCSFSAGNMPAVAEGLRQRYGLATPITIVADRDENGVGEKFGKEAAEKIGARLIVMPVVGEDVNDFRARGGDLAALLIPIKQDDWLVDADDFSSQPMPVKWLIKKQLQENAFMMLHGPSGGGKTFVVLDMVLHIATGRNWNNTKTKQGAVVYLAGEGHQGLRGRIAAWKKANHVDRIGKMWLSKSGTDLNTPAGMQKVVESLESLPEKPCIIVVDTLHRFLDGDENSAQDAKGMIDACDQLRQRFQCSVLLVHHTGVNEDAQHRARGSSAWRGALDIELSVLPDKENECLQLVQMKNKDAELADKVSIKLNTVELDWVDEDGEQVTSAVARPLSCTEIEQNRLENRQPMKENSERLLTVIKQAWLRDGGGEMIGGYPAIEKKTVIKWFDWAAASGSIPWVKLPDDPKAVKEKIRMEKVKIGLTAKREWDMYGGECMQHNLLAVQKHHKNDDDVLIITDPISPIFCLKISQFM